MATTPTTPTTPAPYPHPTRTLPPQYGLCKCPCCEAQHTKLSTFAHQLQPEPFVNRVYCPYCREKAKEVPDNININLSPLS